MGPDYEALIESWFTYHAPFGDQLERYERIRAAARDFARVIHEATPSSPEKTLALRALQEAVMLANSSIAINETKD